MDFIHTLFLIACIATEVLSSSLITPCKVTDSACIDKSVQAAIPTILSGIPSVGVESSDPLFVEKIDGDLSIMKYKLYNTTILGLKNCTVSDIRVTTDFNNLHYAYHCDNVKMMGKYKVKGRLIILPVEGNGDYEILTADVIHKFSHESWPEVAMMVQEPTWYGCFKKVISNVNKYLKTVALEDIMIN